MNCRPRKDSDAEMEIYINEDDELLKDHKETEVVANSVKIAILEIVVLLAVIIYICLIPPA
jgi:hypothetical protein